LFASTTFSAGSIVGAILAGQVASFGGLWAVYPVGAVVASIAAVMIGIAIRQGARGSTAEVAGSRAGGGH
ncbi:MAG TPA: hypothetical protein VES19_13900, partial [Candidatus Limnocylindrales bacterium]|nr:hypothetical protein [Candidatus Limnocylindrales bacterium]